MNFPRPLVQFRVAVAAGIQLGRAVQPNINEVRGQVLGITEFPGGIRKDQRGVVFSEQIDEFITPPEFELQAQFIHVYLENRVCWSVPKLYKLPVIE